MQLQTTNLMYPVPLQISMTNNAELAGDYGSSSGAPPGSGGWCDTLLQDLTCEYVRWGAPGGGARQCMPS